MVVQLPVSNLITMESVQAVEEMCVKRIKCVRLVMKGEMGEHVLRPNVYSSTRLSFWFVSMIVCRSAEPDRVRSLVEATRSRFRESSRHD